MGYGYTGRMLHIDLTTGEQRVEQLPDEDYRRFLGGRAMIAAHLCREMPAGVDPFDPENVLVFAPGVVTGLPVSGQGRHGVGARSPLTGRFGNGEAGGYWGAALKQASLDGLVIRGQASQPVYVHVHGGRAEIREAGHLWGLRTGDAHQRIGLEHHPRRVHTALIGPAGENRVRFANIAHDCRHFAGRTGLGAVMGSKRLKGIVVQPGRERIPMAAPRVLQRMRQWLKENADLYSFMSDLGTPGELKGLSLAGGLPTRNFQEGTFTGDDALAGTRLRDTILKDRGTCFGCVIRCKRVVEVTGERPVDPRYGGPEYETLAAFGSNQGIGDLEAVAKANELCAAFGLDTISTGAVIAFAMECFEHGLLTAVDLDGLDLRFGNAEAALSLVQRIAGRQGIGDLLAEGSMRAAEQIGGGAEDLAMHVKGQELPMHEPRMKPALGVGYAVSPTGADHMHNMNDDFYTGDNRFMLKVRAFGSFEPQPLGELGPEKMRLFYHEVNWRHFLDSAVLCHFPPFDYHQIAEIVNGITGWDTDPQELLQIGVRAVTLAQLFNCREGFGVEGERLPRRFYQPFSSGPLKGAAVDAAAFEDAKSEWYRQMGWDPVTGWPSAECLEGLGLGWAARWLPEDRADGR